MKRSLQVCALALTLVCASPLFAQLAIPEIPYDSAPNLLKMPDNIYLGEAVGVATNSKGHIYVYTRAGSVQVTMGTNRAFVRSAARLFEFRFPSNHLSHLESRGIDVSQPVRLEGRLVSAPQRTPYGSQFDVEASRIAGEKTDSRARSVSGLVRLRLESSEDPDADAAARVLDLKFGDYIRATVRLRRPQTYRNPGSFDFRHWMESIEDIYWVGTIPSPLLIERPAPQPPPDRVFEQRTENATRCPSAETDGSEAGPRETARALASVARAGGYDLVFEANGRIRHVQLKSRWKGGRTKVGTEILSRLRHHRRLPEGWPLSPPGHCRPARWLAGRAR